MKENILFVAIGQCGSNIVQLFENEGYNCLFINTSNDDLETISAKHKLFLTGSTGCAKNRQKAFEYAKQHYQTICDVIQNKFPNQSIINIVFSTSGGTGSGIAPILLDILSSKNPHKSYNAIIVFPSIQESIKCQTNAVECYNQLVKIETLNSLYIIDNSNTESNNDKFNLNSKFFTLYNSIVNITIPDSRGIIDKAELETLLTCKGNSIIVSSEHSNDINEMLSQSIFTDYEYGCEYIALSIKDDIDINTLQHHFGNYIDLFQGYNDYGNIILITGMQFPSKAINKLVQNINIKKETVFNNPIKNNLDFEVPILPNYNSNHNQMQNQISFQNTNQNKKIDTIDFNSLFSKYSSK